MQLNVFVSGKWSAKKEVHQRILELKEMGCQITHDWTQVEASGSRTRKTMGEYARFDVNGVKQSDVHVILMEDRDYAYRGTYTELGVSLALHKQIILMCPFPFPETGEDAAYCQTNVFYHHPKIQHVSSWHEVKDLLQVNLDRRQITFQAREESEDNKDLSKHHRKRKLAQTQEIPRPSEEIIDDWQASDFWVGC